MSEDWKDLEIGNIPSDFFVNDRYEIQEYKKSGEWCIFMLRSPICRWETIRNFNTFGYKYRYRIKPLEPIRITKEINDIIINFIPGGHVAGKYGAINGILSCFNNRKVEIIE